MTQLKCLWIYLQTCFLKRVDVDGILIVCERIILLSLIFFLGCASIWGKHHSKWENLNHLYEEKTVIDDIVLSQDGDLSHVIYYLYHVRATLIRKAIQLHPYSICVNISVLIRSFVELCTQSFLCVYKYNSPHLTQPWSWGCGCSWRFL